jgi:hypothetical protein
MDAWQRDIVNYCRNALFKISIQHAKVKGHSQVSDANEAAKLVKEGDLVFIDPPYSGVHYSRFYHVLETLARGQCASVSGVGRYPEVAERPRSKYSLQRESSGALENLFKEISCKGARAIVTFPQRRCSNGLSGERVAELACEYFRVERHWVSSKFSTLGGDNHHRYARRATRELVLVLHPTNPRTPPETRAVRSRSI